MFLFSFSLFSLVLFRFVRADDVQPFTSYDNDFVDPDFIAAGIYANTTGGAQETITSWAESLSAWGPIGFLAKLHGRREHDGVDAPADLGDHRQHRRVLQSFRLDPVQRAGPLVPKQILLRKNKNKTARFVDTWFLNNDTGMNPNLNYAQMERGPTGQVGTPLDRGVLDLKGMVKIVSGIMSLRKSNSTDWTANMDAAMISWTQRYITWLETNKLGIEECASLNNHGTFCFNQLAALKLLVNDIPGSVNASNTYFNGIVSASRGALMTAVHSLSRRPAPTRITTGITTIPQTSARLLKYADPTSDPWNLTTKDGTTIRDAMNFVMTVNPNTHGEGDDVAEIYPNIAAIASTYGDPNGTYVAFLKAGFPEYAWDADFLWDQPLAGDGVVTTSNSTGSGSGSGSGKSAASTHRGLGVLSAAILALLVGAVVGW